MSSTPCQMHRRTGEGAVSWLGGGGSARRSTTGTQTLGHPRGHGHLQTPPAHAATPVGLAASAVEGGAPSVESGAASVESGAVAALGRCDVSQALKVCDTVASLRCIDTHCITSHYSTLPYITQCMTTHYIIYITLQLSDHGPRQGLLLCIRLPGLTCKVCSALRWIGVSTKTSDALLNAELCVIFWMFCML
jgi:hypothetical protein